MLLRLFFLDSSITVIADNWPSWTKGCRFWTLISSCFCVGASPLEMAGVLNYLEFVFGLYHCFSAFVVVSITRTWSIVTSFTIPVRAHAFELMLNWRAVLAENELIDLANGLVQCPEVEMRAVKKLTCMKFVHTVFHCRFAVYHGCRERVLSQIILPSNQPFWAWMKYRLVV